MVWYVTRTTAERVHSDLKRLACVNCIGRIYDLCVITVRNQSDGRIGHSLTILRRRLA